MKKIFLLLLAVFVVISAANIPEHYQAIESQYPSYVDTNHYGLCLRASCDLDAGVIVATADFEKTDKDYRANDPREEYKYVALMHMDENGEPVWGRIRGKWAFCNHSCDPNCDLNAAGEIVTNRAIKAGEELTTSYDAYTPGFPWPESWNFECLCQSPNCKKIIKEYRMDIVYPSLSFSGVEISS